MLSKLRHILFFDLLLTPLRALLTTPASVRQDEWAGKR